ncbi:MAG TPA: TonB-dependent receptor [Candidatus Omnitrophota bacterium]|nr:TonB-dependent receptor [Candidatus Omnitrophota bacterium]
MIKEYFCRLVCLIGLVCMIGPSSAFDLPRFYGNEVVVTALRLPQLNTDSPWSVDVISKEALVGKSNLGQALRELPGLDIKSSGYLGSVASARARGSTSQQVLTLIDGRRLDSPLLGMFDLGDILLANTDRIEVVRAPLSALYGSDAIGGVVNVITRNEENSFSISAGSYNTQKASLSIGGTDLSLIRSDGTRQNGDYSAQQFGQKLGWDVSGVGTVNAGLSYYNADKGVPGVPVSESDPHSASTPGDRQKDQNLSADISLKRDDGGLKTEAKLYYNNLYEYSRYYDFFALQFTDSDFRTEQKSFELTQSRDFTRNLNLLHGIEAREDSGRSSYAGTHSIDNYALFGQMKYSLPALDLVAGARADQHSAFGAVINPRAGVNIKLADDLRLRASTGTSFKAPTLNDLYYNNAAWQTYGNSALAPERSRSAEIGIEKELGDKASIGMNYFVNSITDLILWDWDLTTNITRAKNIGAVEARGGELEAKYQATPLLDLFANCTLQKSEDTRDTDPASVGKNTPYSPEMKYNIGAEVPGNVRIIASYVGERFADGANTVKLPAYSLVNLWAAREFGNYTVSLSVDNLFDQSYYETVGYNPVTYARLGYPMPGRVMTVSIGGKL